MQTIQLQNLGVCELTSGEMESMRGGEVPSLLKGLTWLTVAGAVIEHWDEITQGFKDGWNAVPIN